MKWRLKMKRLFLTVFVLLIIGLLLAAQTKKVVVTIPENAYQSFGSTAISELKAAAPNINLIVPKKGQMISELADADGIIGIISPELLRAAKKLKWVHVLMAGVEGVLTPELVNSNIILTNCRIIQGPEVADHAMAMLLALTRDLYRTIPKRSKEEWDTDQYNPIELAGKTAVIVGVGGIGTQIGVRAHACGMKVIGIDPRDIPYVPFFFQKRMWYF
jgi:phosphoglycerate dehydrogenase-like enzyme